MALSTSSSRRSQILRATLDVVRRDGWGAVSMRSVAAVTGVTPTALYRHVQDKDELVRSALAEAAGLLAEGIDRAMASERSSEARLWAGLEEIRRFATEEPELYRFVFLGPGAEESASGVGVAGHPSDVALERLGEQLAAWMTDAGLEGEPETVSAVVMAQAHGLVLHWLQGRFRDPGAFADFYREAFWIMLAGVGKQ